MFRENTVIRKMEQTCNINALSNRHVRSFLLNSDNFGGSLHLFLLSFTPTW